MQMHRKKLMELGNSSVVVVRVSWLSEMDSVWFRQMPVKDESQQTKRVLPVVSYDILEETDDWLEKGSELGLLELMEG